METKHVVSNNLVEFVLSVEQAVKDGYSVVKESVDFQAGYFKVLAQKEEGKDSVNTYRIVLDAESVLNVLDNPGEPNEALKEILEADVPVAAQPVNNLDGVRNKMYLVFGGECYYAQGGVYDLMFVRENLEGAEKELLEIVEGETIFEGKGYIEWGHIYCTVSNSIVFSCGGVPYGSPNY